MGVGWREEFERNLWSVKLRTAEYEERKAKAEAELAETQLKHARAVITQYEKADGFPKIGGDA